MIVKSFRKNTSCGYRGQDINSWTKVWENCAHLETDALLAEKDYLSSLFKKYFPLSPKRILEGGCGTGKYVVTYLKKGYDITGVDFSQETIERIRIAFGKDIPVFVGDITSLPYPDAYFDCYYSGGVIEHFEEGPEKALQEARRVLVKGGVFLATVPFLNVIRKIQFSFSKKISSQDYFMKRVNSCSVELRGNVSFNFCEYYFDSKSLEPYFRNSGFLIEKTIPMDLLWGEIGTLLHRILKRKVSVANLGAQFPKATLIPSTSGRGFRGNFKRMLYNFLITENRANPFFRMPLAFLNHLSGHLILFVARVV
jgi:SAM-dependent methyltransferase